MTMKTRVTFWIAAAVLFLVLLTACGEINLRGMPSMEAHGRWHPWIIHLHSNV